MADSTSQVLPIYLNISRILSGDATPYFQPSGFLRKYGVGTIYGQLLTLFDIPPPPLSSPPPIPPQKVAVSDASQAPQQPNNQVAKSLSTSTASSQNGSSVGLMAAIAVLGCIVLSACVAIFVMIRQKKENRIHVEIGDSPIYAASWRKEVSEGGTGGAATEESKAPPGFSSYQNPLPPSGPRNQVKSIYVSGGPRGARLRSSAGGKSLQSSNGGRSSGGGQHEKEAQQPEPYRDSSRWI